MNPVPMVPLHYNLLPTSTVQSAPSFDPSGLYYKGNDNNVICYFSNYAQLRQPPAKYVPENIDARLCTHIFYAFASLDSVSFETVPGDPLVDINDGFYNRLQSVARSQNPDVKIMLALGGWTDSSGDKYSRLVNDPKKRQNFVKKAVNMLKRRNFDGLSLEWQYPVCWQSDCKNGNGNDKAGFTKLVQELKSAFKPKGLLLAAGLAGYTEIAEKAYDLPVLAKNLDMATIYAYDFHGHWDKKAGHQSPLKSSGTYNVQHAMNCYINGGFAKKQLNLGVPFYGLTHTLVSSGQNGVGAPVSSPGSPGKYSNQPGMMAYFEICDNGKLMTFTVLSHQLSYFT